MENKKFIKTIKLDKYFESNAIIVEFRNSSK